VGVETGPLFSPPMSRARGGTDKRLFRVSHKTEMNNPR